MNEISITDLVRVSKLPAAQAETGLRNEVDAQRLGNSPLVLNIRLTEDDVRWWCGHNRQKAGEIFDRDPLLAIADLKARAVSALHFARYGLLPLVQMVEELRAEVLADRIRSVGSDGTLEFLPDDVWLWLERHREHAVRLFPPSFDPRNIQ